MAQDPHASLRQHLVELLIGGHAHAKFEDAIEGLPAKLRGEKPDNFPHSPWMILEHLRITQWDILEFSRNQKHESPKWPEGYWPESATPPSDAAWKKSILSFRRDLDEMKKLVANADEEQLYAPIPHGDGQTLLREALLVADHNSYHLGQLILVRKMLGTWK
jgi:hypothetical protein